MVPDEDDRRWRYLYVGVFVAYVLIRLSVFAVSDNGIDFHHNAYDRGLFVQRWLAHYEAVPDAAYGPVGYYLVAAVMAVVPDPVLAPRLLSLISSVFVFFLVGSLARRVFGRREAVVALVLLAAHPHGIRLSVVGLDMMPYAALLLAGFWAFDHFTQDERPARWGVISGLFFTLAAATRFESWAVLPFVGLLAIARRRAAAAWWLGAAALFPAGWMIWLGVTHGDPLYFLHISEGVSSIQVGTMSTLARLRVWPLVLARDGPLPTVLLGLAAFITRRRVKRAWPLMIAAAATFAVFELQAWRGTVNTAETKYLAPLVMFIIPQGASEWLRRIEGRWFERVVAGGMGLMLILLSAAVTVTDDRRFAAPEGAQALAAFLRDTPRAPERVVLGTSLQGYLLVNGSLLDGRAAIPGPGPSGSFTEDDLRAILSEPCARYLEYQYDSPVDFAPVLRLPESEPRVERIGFVFERVFFSSDGRYSVYRVEPLGDPLPPCGN